MKKIILSIVLVQLACTLAYTQQTNTKPGKSNSTTTSKQKQPTYPKTINGPYVNGPYVNGPYVNAPGTNTPGVKKTKIKDPFNPGSPDNDTRNPFDTTKKVKAVRNQRQ